MAEETDPRPLPKYLDADTALARIEALTTTARTTWLVLLGFLAFIGLTLLSIRDVDFFSATATTDLPIVNIAIPTVDFFWTASMLAAVLHTYFHVLLLKLWDALAEAPPSIGYLKLGDRVFPWLVNDWALRWRADRPTTKRPMDLLGRVVTALVVWLATPLLLVGFWWRSLPAHDAILSLAIAAALLVTLFASLRGWRSARRRLAKPGLPRDARRFERRSFGEWAKTVWRSVPVLALWLALLLGLPALFFATIAGAGGHRLPPIVEHNVQAYWPEAWQSLASFAERHGLPLAPEIPVVRANLVDAEIAERPDDWREYDIARRRFHAVWCQENNLPSPACESPLAELTDPSRRTWCLGHGIDHKDCEVRFAEIDEQFDAEWRAERQAYLSNSLKPNLAFHDLRGAFAKQAFVVGVDLSGARLQKAVLWDAWLEGAVLWKADLKEADLRGAHLEGADLRGANLQRADLRRVYLKAANLTGADLDGANMQSARLDRALLINAGLRGANLNGAQFGRADFLGARLEGANLSGAQFQQADFSSAHLEGANFSGAELQSTVWAGATMGPSLAHSADLSGGKGLTQFQLRHVIGNERTILPRDDKTGEPLRVWTCWEEDMATAYIELAMRHQEVTVENIRSRLIGSGSICAPDNPPRRVGMLAEETVEDAE